MWSRMAGVAAASTRRLGTRSFACLSVSVEYRTLRTTRADLLAMFEQVGKVWEVRLLESPMSGRLLERALVLFYDGDYQPANAPEARPVLPPPSDTEIREVTRAVDHAIARFNNSTLNGVQINVRRTGGSPTQLHVWYENQSIDKADGRPPLPDIFPVNPFYELTRMGDDYQQGFMTGFKLGLKDGSKGPAE
ncbi:hypothetical protein H4R20_005835 [Coemansia guatemalensis]|uniref:RRM domain-containing protein n=1 Tax=Coemansia guatemalensis TaxID=2761395 RepID=A0A9W8HPM2_9FUNG|nr:hypothetical protein H4R20_005835 [Coemansia guatemalensis]